jgi:hypothetical protein
LFDVPSNSCGTVFELSPKAGGGWAEKVIHSFSGNGEDGYTPVAGLIFDSSGNLYGTTEGGGTCNFVFGCGTVFGLSPEQGGGWGEEILISFQRKGEVGKELNTGLVFDTSGNLYGSTETGSTYRLGSSFELSPQANGGWQGTVLHVWGNGDDGFGVSSFVRDTAGNLYGATMGGGANNCGTTGAPAPCGTVFKLSLAEGGSWTETVLYNLNKAGGYFPEAGVILDASGNLYVSTWGGGAYGHGAVIEITP